MSRIAEKFDGETYHAKRDKQALSVQLDHVRSHMISRPGWHTLEEIAAAVGLKTGAKPSTASVSARLRDLRKTQFGAYTIERRIREGSGRLWEYHLDFPNAVAKPNTPNAGVAP